jgi:hypothetical protein
MALLNIDSEDNESRGIQMGNTFQGAMYIPWNLLAMEVQSTLDEIETM